MGIFCETYNELRLRSHDNGRIFDRLNKLTGHFVHTGPFNIFALFKRNFERG